MFQYSCSFNQFHSHRTWVPGSLLDAYGEKQQEIYISLTQRKKRINLVCSDSISHSVLIAVPSVGLIGKGSHSPDDKFN